MGGRQCQEVEEDNKDFFLKHLSNAAPRSGQAWFPACAAYNRIHSHQLIQYIFYFFLNFLDFLCNATQLVSHPSPPSHIPSPPNASIALSQSDSLYCIILQHFKILTQHMHMHMYINVYFMVIFCFATWSRPCQSYLTTISINNYRYYLLKFRYT